MKLIDVETLLIHLNNHCDICKEQADYYEQKCKICEMEIVFDIIDGCPVYEIEVDE